MIHWLSPGDPARRTGGFLYNARMVAGLRDRGHGVRVHRLDGSRLDAAPVPVERPVPASVTATSSPLREVQRELRGPFLLGASACLMSVHLGEDKDLPGWQTGVVVMGRYALREDLRLAASVGWRGRRDLLPPAYTDTWLVQTMVPVQLGARYAAEGRVGFEVGADLLMGWSGMRTEGAGFRLGGVLALGLAVPLGDGLRLRLDGEVAGGRAYVSSGAGLGLERSF